jgi:hypothetical protein
MPRKAIIRILLATIAGLALWLPAPAAYADDPCCSISVSGLPGTFQAGADPSVFNGTITVNSGPNPLQGFRNLAAQVGIQARDLSGSQVHFAWRPQNGFGNWHTVGFSRRNGLLQATFYPYQNTLNAGQANITMRLSFGEKVTSQQIQLSAVLVGSARKSDAKQLAHAGPFGAAIVGTAGAATPPPATPTPTPAQPTPSDQTSTAPAGDTPTLDSSSPYAGALPGANPADTNSSSSGIWVLYIIGGLLLVGGIGVIGTLLWKRAAEAPEWVDPNDPAIYGTQNADYQAGYPTQSFDPTAYPTTTGRHQAPEAYPTTAYPQQGAYPPPQQGVRPPTDPTRQMPGL